MMYTNFQMSNEQRAIALAKMAAKRGTATAEQLALLDGVKSKKAADKKAADDARKVADKKAEQWAKDNAEEIERVRKENENYQYDETFKMYYTIVDGKKQWA